MSAVDNLNEFYGKSMNLFWGLLNLTFYMMVLFGIFMTIGEVYYTIRGWDDPAQSWMGMVLFARDGFLVSLVIVASVAGVVLTFYGIPYLVACMIDKRRSPEQKGDIEPDTVYHFDGSRKLRRITINWSGTFSRRKP